MALILAVDDSRSMRDMVSYTLKTAGHEVILAEDGVDALEKAQGASVNLVLTDVNMPRMDGLSLIRALRKLPGYRFVPIDQPSLVFLYKQREMAQAFQMYLPYHPFAEDEGSGDGVGPYVFAPKSHEPLVEIGAEMLWLDTESGMALWREPAQP